MLLLKLLLVPALIGLVSLAGRRWGPGVSGLLAGLPWTSGPVLVFLAVERGAGFATEAAAGILAGVLSLAAFCLAYAWAAGRFGWAVCAGLGSAAYLGATVWLFGAQFAPVVAFAAVALGLAFATAAMPRAGGRSGPGGFTRGEIPLRMISATGVVVALTALATLLGPRLAGLLAPFPVYASVLAIFSHRSEGAGAAQETLRGVLGGSYSFAVFFLIAAVGIEPLGVAPALVASGVSAAALHVVLLDRQRLGVPARGLPRRTEP